MPYVRKNLRSRGQARRGGTHRFLGSVADKWRRYSCRAAIGAGVTWSRRGVADDSMMMGRLPSCTAHDVDRVLTRQGFIVTHQRESHRYYKRPITGTIVTSVPIHPGDLNRS